MEKTRFLNVNVNILVPPRVRSSPPCSCDKPWIHLNPDQDKADTVDEWMNEWMIILDSDSLDWITDALR